jgi:lipid II:glycine glycyltransferase (peptidoglycan interpeptide bridge formation enzyme)
MDIVNIDNMNDDAWDAAISEFDCQFFFHRACWLRFLEETQAATPLRFKIVEDGKIAGYFAGLILKKGFLRILGSPLSKWETEYMGPVCNNNIDVERFLDALDRMCRKMKIHHIEIGSPIFKQEMMKTRGYNCMEWQSYFIPISYDKKKMWDSLTSKCRNRIRKGIKNGLTVEKCNNISFVEEHYNQLEDVYGKQGRLPGFSIDTLRCLFKHLNSQNMLFTLQVKHNERVVASGIFSHDASYVCSLSTASYRKDQKLYPNELLIWNVMCLSGEIGIKKLSIGNNYRTIKGSGKFKDKFNGQPVVIYRYYKSYTIVAKIGRQVYKNIFYARQKIRDNFRFFH